MVFDGRQAAPKAISFVVPCYHSAGYMDNCIRSLVNLNSGDNDIEIIIVDDGSREDNTLEKALHWGKEYPEIIRVIHQENSGHGGAVNAGLKNARGLYFKVVDSDDSLDLQGTAPIMEYIRGQARAAAGGADVTDLVIGNFVYNKASRKKPLPIRYTHVLPRNREFTRKDIGRFRLGQYLSMHSMIHRTGLLRDISLELPLHTFYVDNILVCFPLPHVKSAYYIDTNMYVYNIGREDQSVNEKVILTRLDHLLRVMKTVIDATDCEKLKKEPKLERYTFHHLAQMMSTCTVALRLLQTPEADRQRKEIWEYLKKHDRRMYRAVFRSIICCGTSIPGKIGRFICVTGYRVVKKIIPFT